MEKHSKINSERLAFSIQETADALGVSTKSVHRLLHRGLLKSCRALRRHIISKTEIERFLETTTGLLDEVQEVGQV